MPDAKVGNICQGSHGLLQLGKHTFTVEIWAVKGHTSWAVIEFSGSLMQIMMKTLIGLSWDN